MIADVQPGGIFSPHNRYGVPKYAGIRMSKEEFLNWESDDNYVYEYTNGILEPTTSMRQEEIPLFTNLENAFFSTQTFREGGRLRAEVDVWLTDERYRRPEVAYYSAEQLQQIKRGERVVPSFVVEFGSVSDQEDVSMKKRHEYFDAGVQVVWWVFPIYKEVVVYTSPINMTGRHHNDVLSASPVLPDFELTVAELFA